MTEPMNGMRRGLWMLLLVAASLLFTLGFACATPLAGLGAVAAFTLGRRDAVLLMLGVWLANQAAGFLLLGYPPTPNAFAWGVVLGGAALLAMEVARLADRAAIPLPLRWAAGFAAAFAAFEVVLYAASVAALGGLDAYTAAIVGRILEINASAALALLALHRLAFRPGAGLLGAARPSWSAQTGQPRLRPRG